jgi:2-keto-4-pentenoate hydratase
MSDAGHKAIPAWDPTLAASLLLRAREDGNRIDELADAVRPNTVEQAYAIQDATVRQQGRVGAWKVSPMRPGAPPNCAPIAASHLHASPACITGIAAPEVEVEIAVRLGRDLPAREAAYEADEMRAAVAALHPAIEVLDSRFLDRRAVSPFSAMADGQSNAAVVIGDGLEGWGGLDLGRLAIRLRIAGRECAATDGGAGTDNVLAALAWLANHAAARCGGLKKGDVVITGARIGPWSVTELPAEVAADVAGLGNVTITFS